MITMTFDKNIGNHILVQNATGAFAVPIDKGRDMDLIKQIVYAERVTWSEKLELRAKPAEATSIDDSFRNALIVSLAGNPQFTGEGYIKFADSAGDIIEQADAIIAKMREVKHGND